MPFLFLKKYWKSVLIAIIILILSIATFSSVPSVTRFEYSDKVAHLLMYIGLGIVLVYDYGQDKEFGTRIKKWKWHLVVFAVLWGGAIELLQGYCTMTRKAELLDWVADIVGVGLGFLIGILINRVILSLKKKT